MENRTYDTSYEGVLYYRRCKGENEKEKEGFIVGVDKIDDVLRVNNHLLWQRPEYPTLENSPRENNVQEYLRDWMLVSLHVFLLRPYLVNV